MAPSIRAEAKRSTEKTGAQEAAETTKAGSSYLNIPLRTEAEAERERHIGILGLCAHTYRLGSSIEDRNAAQAHDFALREIEKAQELRKILAPFARYADELDKAKVPDTGPIGWDPGRVTVFATARDCRLARAAMRSRRRRLARSALKGTSDD